MNDAAVARAGGHPDSRELLHQKHVFPAARHGSRNRAFHYTAADDQNVRPVHNLELPSTWLLFISGGILPRQTRHGRLTAGLALEQGLALFLAFRCSVDGKARLFFVGGGPYASA